MKLKFVVTAPAFFDDNGTIGQNHIKVPSHVWKAIYSPKKQASWAFLCKNQDNSECKSISVKDLETLTKTKIFS